LVVLLLVPRRLILGSDRRVVIQFLRRLTLGPILPRKGAVGTKRQPRLTPRSFRFSVRTASIFPFGGF
jgi:hypothetical protein